MSPVGPWASRREHLASAVDDGRPPNEEGSRLVEPVSAVAKQVAFPGVDAFADLRRIRVENRTLLVERMRRSVLRMSTAVRLDAISTWHP